MATTLDDLITDIRNRADLNDSEFITDIEMTSYINYSLQELHALIINSFGGDYFVSSVTGTIDANTNTLSQTLPDDCYKIMGVDLAVNSTQYITLQPFNFNERNRASAQNMQGYATQQWTNYRYRVVQDTIMLTPNAAGPVNLKIWYVPTAPQLTGSADAISNNDALSGWLEYVITDVCIKGKEKEDTDASLFLRQKQALVERIKNESQFRDQGMPATVTDIYAAGTVTDANNSSWWNYGDMY